MGFRPNNLGQCLEIYLVTDTLARRQDAHVAKRLLRPFRHPVTLRIARKLRLHVPRHCVRRTRHIDDHGMIHDEIDRPDGIDQIGIAA